MKAAGVFAARIVEAIENHQAPAPDALQDLAIALGGRAQLQPMTPEGKLLYVLCLAVAHQAEISSGYDVSR